MITALTLAAALSAHLTSAAPPAPPPLRRIAIIAGSNDGGPQREMLRYALTDAERFAHVLQQFGGLTPEDTILLLDPTEQSFRASLDAMNTRLARARDKTRTELLLYYSGHSDEQGLLLHGSRIPYADLRRWLASSGADVRIAILDSCSSGALTREKGGVHAPPFLLDTSTQVTGHAFLTSSAADEASQESDRIGSSFFTYYFLTGLRGAADTSLDGRVTLHEAYQYAFQETLARTERTRSGPQHPGYDIQLVGSGDVVMTELRGAGATLAFPEAAGGRFFVRDAGQRLVAELRKLPGRQLELGLDPGEYRVTREEGGVFSETRVKLASGQKTELDLSGFTEAQRELTARRGDDADELVRVPIDISLFPPVSINGDRRTVNHFQLGLIGSRTTRLRGVGIAAVVWAEEDARGLQLGYVGNSTRGLMEGVQLSNVANVAGDLQGLQLTSGVNVSRNDVAGAQLAAAANWAQRDVEGAQVAIVNRAESVTGTQIGLVNVLEKMEGAQISLINMGGEVSGTQIGLVNVAGHVRGLQLGLINVSDDIDGVPIGLISVARNGEQHLSLLGDQDRITSIELSLGSSRFHSLLTVGMQPQRLREGAGVWAGGGLGTHLGREPWSLDVDALALWQADRSQPAVLAKLRLLGGFALTRHFEIVAGPTVNLLFPGIGPRPDVGRGIGKRDLWVGGKDRGQRWFGFTAGLRF